MPELPEVEVIRGWLNGRVYGRGLAGATLESLEPRQAPLRHLHLDGPRRVRGVRRWGKELAFALEGSPTLAVHLRLTGDLVAGDREGR